MKLDEIVAWYQKKIGTYDKQQWEKTAEQKILDGFSSVTLKTAKLKTELIDVDLVRGSTFPKAKPKQSLLTVIRFAILRYLFLPLYARWWVKQTSPRIFGILLFLYITQMINWAVYTFNVNRLEECAVGGASSSTSSSYNDVANSTVTAKAEGNDVGENQLEEHIVPLSELLIPMSLSLLLSLIHSQIVATNTASGAKVKRRRFSNTSQNGVPREPRVRRRKKLVRNRSQDVEAGAPLRKPMSNAMKKPQKSTLHVPLESIPFETCSNTTKTYSSPFPADHTYDQEVFFTTSTILRSPYQTNVASDKLNPDLKLKSVPPSATIDAVGNSTDCLTDNPTSYFKKVNWHSPIHNYATDTQEKQQQTSPQQLSSSTTSETNTPSNPGDEGAVGGSSSSSSSVTPNKTVHIMDSVEEFYEDLINRTDMVAEQAKAKDITDNPSNVAGNRRTIGEDDGFESLNGKSSSGEDTINPTVLPTTSAVVMKNQMRLRLNTPNYLVGGKLEETESKASTSFRHKVPLSSESEYEKNRLTCPTTTGDAAYQKTKKTQTRVLQPSSEETDEEGDDGDIVSTPASASTNCPYNECTTSATEWLGVTTNSEECTYSSDLDNSDAFKNYKNSDEDGYDLDFTPTTILNPHGTERISCTIWDHRDIKKAQMSVLEISSCIIERVESMPETNDYIYFGIGFSILLSLIPCFCRLCDVTIDADRTSEINYLEMPMLLWEKASFSFLAILRFAFGHTQWERTVLIIGCMQRLFLTMILFIIFAVAERTFKQKFLYAKLFSHLTSSRRARKSDLPHFRLNKVRNIKTWLSVRSYLKKRGPQRSVDVIVSAAFIVTLLLLAFLSVEWLKDSVQLHSQLNLEALMWSTTIGIFLLRFMTLGNKIHHKYRSVSVLITEQINLYLQIEQKPKKKDELMVSNSVLKLAADLLKELESPFKISGLSANPYLFTTIKVVILSALSGVLSEMLGFKLKLHKIKIK